jgi:hypothetical protein
MIGLRTNPRNFQLGNLDSGYMEIVNLNTLVNDGYVVAFAS